jgi:hypothetical protein
VPFELTGRAAPRPVALRRPRVLSDSTAATRSQRSTQRSNGQTQPDAQVTHSACAREAPTGRAAKLTGRVTLGVRFESSKGPLVTGRVQSIVTGCATASDRPREL